MPRFYCALGEHEVDTPAPVTIYREVTGWERIRDEGGANAITLRHETGRFACKSHVEQAKRGVLPGQMTLI